jgi:hypothetical protein
MFTSAANSELRPGQDDSVKLLAGEQSLRYAPIFETSEIH